MKGKKYSREEWEAAKAIHGLGKSWPEVAEMLGRKGPSLGMCITANDGDWEKYNANFRAKKDKTPKRKTEQLIFYPPKVPKAPKKIQVKSMSEQEFYERKMKLAKAQHMAIQNFITELRNAGFRI